jgi:hypothetical protein
MLTVYNLIFHLLCIVKLDILIFLFVFNLSLKLGYEIRSTSVHEKMLQMWKKNFDVKTVSKSKVCYVFIYTSCISYIVF